MFPSLKTPPINEAVIEVLAQIPNDVKVKDFENFHEKIKSEYPERKPISTWQGIIQFDQKLVTPQPTTSVIDLKGMIYYSKDQRQAIQFRLDGFAFSRLRPYLGWDHLINETRKYFANYVEIAKPISISRISMRNINVIEIQGDQFEMDDYFLSTFTISEKLKIESTRNFLVRLDVMVENGIRALITQTIQPSPNPFVVPILFDVDVLMEKSLPVAEDVILKSLDKLHTIKNEIFFGSVTDKTLEMFK